MNEAQRAERETQIVRALLEDWRVLNEALFGRALRPPVLRLTDGLSTLGAWRAGVREMTIQAEFARTASWGRVLEVLKHEMAHQFVDEILRVKGEGPHGRAFRRVCEERSIDGRAVESEGPPEGSQTRGRGLLDRVEKLLALAGSDNQHEAEAAMQRAQALMQEHNLDVFRRTSMRRYGFMQLGVPKGRIYEPARQIALILSGHFFVDSIWVSAFNAATGRRGWVLEVCGTDENLVIAEYVHGFLWDTAERLWRAHKKEHGIRSQRDRRRFHTGVMRGFAEKLGRGRVAAEARGMVWMRDADLLAYLRARHPHIRTVRRSGERAGAALEAGRAAGRRVVLSKAIHTTRNRGRLLGPGG